MPLPAPTRQELLAPAGDRECMHAAVVNGADAIYFGLSEHNARHRAKNFTLEELPEIIQYLHAHNVRGYLTLNTLIFSDELSGIVRIVEGIAHSGADAVIVQDLGLAALIHRIAPDLPIHASTQMTLTEGRSIDFVKNLGVERVILARELSVEEIAKARQQTDMPLEVFVHGALCVAYSGQCLTSEALGGRSANRGQCAQACRLPYEMLVDGKTHELGERAYLLSPQDLAAYEVIDPLVQLGVQCFKIEGRLKSPSYVAITTQTYRRALDAALAQETYQISDQESRDLQQSFSRGFTHGFLDGVNHQELVEGRFPKSRGARLGTVVAVTRRGIVVEGDEIRSRVKPGDGIVFDEGRPEEPEQGGRARSVSNHLRGVELIFARDDVQIKKVSVGARVWKTDDPEFRKRMEQSFSRDQIVHRAPIDFSLSGHVGGPLTLEAECENRSASVSWPGPLEEASKSPLTLEGLRDQLNRLGSTPFQLGTVRLDTYENLHVPRSVLNQLRRDVVDRILELRESQSRCAVVEPDALENWRARLDRKGQGSEPRLTVLARTLDQLRAVLAYRPTTPLARPAMVYCDFEDVKRYREAVELANAAQMPVGLATIRILKPSEMGLIRQIASLKPDAFLIRALGALPILKELAPEVEMIGDFSLNVANELTADLFLNEGIRRLVPSYDLNWEQLQAMTKQMNPEKLEVVVHQHMPMFHMEHCVYAAFLSDGKDWRDCGRPCDHHQVDLRDRVDARFPVLVDVGCRNTVYNALPQSAAEHLPRMLKSGLRWFRVELLRESPDQISSLLEQYGRVVAGIEDGRAIWKELRALNQLGVTRGTLQLV